MEVKPETHVVFLVANLNKEHDLVSKLVEVLYSKGRKYISLLETPFEVVPCSTFLS